MLPIFLFAWYCSNRMHEYPWCLTSELDIRICVNRNVGASNLYTLTVKKTFFFNLVKTSEIMYDVSHSFTNIYVSWFKSVLHGGEGMCEIWTIQLKSTIKSGGPANLGVLHQTSSIVSSPNVMLYRPKRLKFSLYISSQSSHFLA